jgi:hypothetical protein
VEAAGSRLIPASGRGDKETTMIEVMRRPGDDPMTFDVVVSDAGGVTRHRVTMKAADFERLARGATPERCVEAAFRFLLDREPKESILRSFDVSMISRYFPEFEKGLTGYM